MLIVFKWDFFFFWVGALAPPLPSIPLRSPEREKAQIPSEAALT